MTDVDMTDRFDVLVRDALRLDADRAPSLPAEWVAVTDAVVIDRRSTHRPARRFVIAAVGIAATVALLTVLAVARYERGDPAPASVPPAWQPDGVESPIVDLGPATYAPQGPVVAALTREVGVNGHPSEVLSTVLSYSGGPTAEQMMCTSESGGSGCRPESNPATWSISVTSSVDNGVADFDLWELEGLPANAAFVTYAQGDQLLWQRPVAGFVAFPYQTGASAPVVTAYDELGAEVGRYDEAEYLRAVAGAEIPAQVDLTTEEFQQVDALTRESLRACLTDHGGTITGDVASFADGSDVAVWDECVSTVKQVVAARVTELAG